MAKRDIIVIGASAGGVEALPRLVSGLPSDLAAAVFIILHTAPRGGSLLPNIMNRAGPLPARHPFNGEPIRRGHIYVAPPDHHMLVAANRAHLSRGPRQNRHRPAVDVLFQSAAQAFGDRTIGVILSGALDDGALGLQAVKGRGGIALVQDPREALYPDMPEAALRFTAVDEVLPLAQIARRFIHWTRTMTARKLPSRSIQASKPQTWMTSMAAKEMADRFGAPSVFVCPD